MSILDYSPVTDWLQFNQDISALVTKLLHAANNLHISDSALAEMTGTNRMRISRLRDGNFDIELVFLLADLLGVSIKLYTEEK